MPALDTAAYVLIAISVFAAFVNGALGYGYSSLTVPLALVFYTNRILNPAIVIMEVFINLYVLFINRKGVPAIWRRVLPVVLGLLPGNRQFVSNRPARVRLNELHRHLNINLSRPERTPAIFHIPRLRGDSLNLS